MQPFTGTPLGPKLGSFGGAEIPSQQDIAGGGGAEPTGESAGSPVEGEGEGNLIKTPRQELWQGPEGVFVVGRIASGTFSRTVAAGGGNQTITGLMFPPYMIYLIATSTTEIDPGGASIGFDFDPSTSLARSAMYRLTGAGVYWGQANFVISIYETGTKSWSATLGSVNSVGFVIAWTMNGTPASGVDVAFVAFGRG